MIALLWEFVKGPLLGVLSFVVVAVHVWYNAATDVVFEHGIKQLVDRGS